MPVLKFVTFVFVSALKVSKAKVPVALGSVMVLFVVAEPLSVVRMFVKPRPMLPVPRVSMEPPPP